MGLLCAEQNVGNLKKRTSRNYGTPVRRTRRRKSQQIDFQEFWDSCAQNKTSDISRIALSGILGLLCAEQNVGNLKNMHFQEFKLPKQTPLPGAEPFWVGCPLWGPRFEPKSSQIHPRGLFRTALGALLLFQTRLKNSLCDLTFPMCLLLFFRLRRSFLRVFSIFIFCFLPILYRGLGHHFCNCRASLVPLWVPLPVFSSPPGLFYTLLAAARGSQKAVFFD